MAQNGYTQSKLTPGLWKHHMRPIQFFLIVDDFGIKKAGRDYAEHLNVFCKKNMRSPQIGEERNMLDSSWTWTAKTKKSTSQCQGMCTKHWCASITNNPRKCNTNHTPMFHQNMEQQFNMQRQKTPCLHLKKKNSFRMSPVYFCIMHRRLTE